MKRYDKIIVVFLLLILFSAGCGTEKQSSVEAYNEKQENHAATKTYREGYWKVRYNCWSHDYTDRIKSTTFTLSVDVYKDLTEQDMLDIMDYYEFTRNSQWGMDGEYLGERETDYTCYAVFYRGGTDEEIRRIKYCNGKEVVIQEEDKYCFATPESHSSEEEIGEEGINGSLP